MIYLKKQLKVVKKLIQNEKLGLCLYEDIRDEQELILISEEIITQHDVETKQLKEENEKVESRKVESRKEGNETLKKKK